MSKYAIIIKETLSRTVIVNDVKSMDEALDKVIEAVEDGEILLDDNDYDDQEIKPSPYYNDEIPEDEDVSWYQHIN